MKTNTPLFYYPSKHVLLLNANAFEQVKPFIQYAVVSFAQDIYTLEFTCHQSVNKKPMILYNGKVISQKEVCKQCIHRLKPLVGNACPIFEPIHGKMSCNFDYLLSHLDAIHAKEHNELLTYRDMYSSYKNSENEMKNMSYQEYNHLLSFFAKLNQGIDTLHSWRGFFSKFLR